MYLGLAPTTGDELFLNNDGALEDGSQQHYSLGAAAGPTSVWNWEGGDWESQQVASSR